MIENFINMGLIYEDTRHNCVFVGFDRADVPRYAMLRSSDPRSTFMREWDGSDKRFSFATPMNSRERLCLFESAIDCLSFIELQRMRKSLWKPDNYLSLSGVYQPREAIADTPLPLALSQYLADSPQIRSIDLCLDSDEAGEQAASTIITLLGGKYEISYTPPDRGKDYNELLMKTKGIETQVKTRGAHSAPYHFQEEIER